ncbi:MAG: ABC transporter permease [Eubacteriales bacterium]|nr:ABC transporter permease [Eubacteriales bacterium]
MRRYLDLVPISAKVHQKQSKMTRICIILAVFLVAVMFGLADMYLQGAIQKQMQTSGNWHYQFSALDADTATLISVRPEVEVSGWHNTVKSDAGYSINEQPVAISGQDEVVFEDIYLNTLTEGSYPTTENEIAVSSSIKEATSLELGALVDLVRPDGSSASFSVVGFLDNEDAARLVTGETSIAVLTPDGFDALAFSAGSPMTDWDYVIQLSRRSDMANAIADIKVKNGLSDEQVTANESLLSVEGQLAGTNVSQIYQVALLLSIIVMLTCILMISSTLNSNVMQRTQFFGSMRCLGATKKQIMRFVRHEGLHWCKTAIPIGIGLSIIVVWILSAAMRIISPQWFSAMPVFGISWISIVVSIILGLLTVLLAARSPAKKAAKVSPLEAVSGNAQQVNSFHKAANTNRFKIETALGVHHAKAGKKNYILMTGAFAICIALFLSFTTLVDFMKNAFIPPEWTAELSIVSESNTCSIDNSMTEAVSQNNAVKRAFGRMFAYDVPAMIQGNLSNSNVISYEENQFKWAEDSLIEGSVDPVRQKVNQVLFVDSETSDVHVGDSIVLSINGEERKVTVAGILSDSPLARLEGTETIFCSEETFTGLTGENGYTIIDVQFQNSASQQDVKEVESLFTGDVTFSNNLSAVQQQRNLYRAFAVLVYGFLSIIVAITVFHIMNTINMGVAAKMKQYGAMRAIGMSDWQLVKMIVAEATTYAVSGIIAGCIIGIPLHWVVFVSLITNFWGIAWNIPFLALGLIICVVLLTTVLAVRGPAKRLHAMSIVENISAH